jgi:hypothetical protein
VHYCIVHVLCLQSIGLLADQRAGRQEALHRSFYSCKCFGRAVMCPLQQKVYRQQEAPSAAWVPPCIAG